MSAQQPEDPHAPKRKQGDVESKYISYQTNKVPWWIHAMWAIFTVAGILYMLKFAVSDFIRWW